MSTRTVSTLFGCLLVAALSASGCARGIASGGGSIPSVNPETRGAKTANFGFWGDSCGLTTSGNFNYHDRSVYADKKGGGLKLIGPVFVDDLATDDTLQPCLELRFSAIFETLVLTDQLSRNGLHEVGDRLLRDHETVRARSDLLLEEGAILL